MSAPTVITPDQVLEPEVVEVSDGIYAYLQLYGQWGLNNAGFVVGPDHVLVVDTCFTVDRAAAFRRRLEATTPKRPRTLVNTHHHGDHTYGNFLFRDTTIIGHELCREEMIETGLETTKLFQEGVNWGDIEIEPPAVTFRDRLDLHVGDLAIEAIFVGPGHTTNDVVYYIPDRKLLFAGDLVFAGGTPFVLMGSVQGSLDAYARLRELDIETIVPGHGPICGPEVIDDMAAYLEMVQATAAETFPEGTPPLEVSRDLDLGDYADWHDAERIVGNLHRAYDEWRDRELGAGLDYGPIVADMVTYSGGQALHCLA